MKKIVNIYESKVYQEDNDFENEEKKDEYYASEFWYDSDYLTVNGEEYSVICVDDEIILLNDDIDLTTSQTKRLIAFYTDELFDQYKATGQFIELSTWPQDIKESSRAMKAAPLAIKYRGGQGYNYGWWVLN